MKVLKKICLILVIVMIFNASNSFATLNYVNETNETNETNTTRRKTTTVVKNEDETTEETGTNYNIISEEGKVKFKTFVEIKNDYQTYCIVEGIMLLIAVIMVVKTQAIDTSTKSCLLIAVLAVAAYIFQFAVTGNIIYVLDILLQIFGIVLVVLSYYYIFRHKNLLMYVPICACGIYYSINHLTIVSQNILYKIFLIASPIILFILGSVLEKTDEAVMLKPVKEKHERKKDNETKL